MHAHFLYSVPLANADSGYMATKRTVKELTTPGRLAHNKSVAAADKMCILAAALVTLLNTSPTEHKCLLPCLYFCLYSDVHILDFIHLTGSIVMNLDKIKSICVI